MLPCRILEPSGESSLRFGRGPSERPVADPLLVAARIGAIAGAAVVALAWWRAPSLWIDEIFLALNLRERGWSGLAGALDYRQVAPLGFLGVEKLATTLGGSGERVLRLAPSLAAAAAFLLLPAWLGRLARPLGVAVATWIAAGAAPLVLNTVQTKAAGFDLLAGVVLPLAWLAAVEGHARDGRLACGLTVALAALSFATPLVLAGTLAGILVSPGLSRRLRSERALRAPLAGAVAAGFAFPLVARARLDPTTAEFLAWFWRDARPRGGGGAELADWLLDWAATSVRMATGVTGRDAVLALAGVAVVGWIVAARGRRAGGEIAAAVVVTGLAVAAGGLYPAHGRLSLFLAPAWLAGIAASAGLVDRFERRAWRALAAVALVAAGAAGLDRQRPGLAIERPRELVARLVPELRARDVVVLRPTAAPAWRWYASGAKLPASVVVRPGACLRDRLGETARELAPLGGRRRVWVVFSHSGPTAAQERAVLELLRRAGSERGRVAVGGGLEDVAFRFDFGDRERFDAALADPGLAAIAPAEPPSCRQLDRAGAYARRGVGG